MIKKLPTIFSELIHKKSTCKINNLVFLPNSYLNIHSFIAPINYSLITLTYKSIFSFAKKKQDKKTQKQKQKQKIKQNLGQNATQIDLNKYQQPYKRVIQNYKSFLNKCKAGKLDASSFDQVDVRIGKDKLEVKHLAQIAPKNSVSVIINPYDSDNLQAIQKAIKASDDSLQILRVEKSLTVSLPNSSIKQLKQKMIQKIKKSLNDQKQMLKKQRHLCQQQLKKYKKVAQQDKLRQIQKEAKDIYDKYNDILQKMMKQKEKQLLK